MTGYETQLRGYERGNAAFHHTRETNTGKRGTSIDERRMKGGNAASSYTRDVNISKTRRWDPIERIWEGEMRHSSIQER